MRKFFIVMKALENGIPVNMNGRILGMSEDCEVCQQLTQTVCSDDVVNTNYWVFGRRSSIDLFV